MIDGNPFDLVGSNDFFADTFVTNQETMQEYPFPEFKDDAPVVGEKPVKEGKKEMPLYRVTMEKFKNDGDAEDGKGEYIGNVTSLVKVDCTGEHPVLVTYTPNADNTVRRDIQSLERDCTTYKLDKDGDTLKISAVYNVRYYGKITVNRSYTNACDGVNGEKEVHWEPSQYARKNVALEPEWVSKFPANTTEMRPFCLKALEEFNVPLEAPKDPTSVAKQAKKGFFGKLFNL